MAQSVNFPLVRSGPSIGKRMLRAIARVCIALLIVFAAMLAWQSHRDEAKAIISTWLPALSPLLPSSTSAQDTTLPQSAPGTQKPAFATGATSSGITHQLELMASDLAGARRDLGQLADIARDLADTRRTLEQLAAREEQMAQAVATLQRAERDIKQRLASSPQGVPIAPRRRPQSTVQSSTVPASSIPPATATQQPLPLH